MKWTINRANIGKNPEVTFLKSGTLKVFFPVAEDYSVNKGTKDNPDWVVKNTTWYNLTAFGGVAQQIIDELYKEGDAVKVEGFHSKNKYKDNYYDNYIVTSIEKL